MHLLTIGVKGAYLNNKEPPTDSINIVTSRPKMNLQNSINFSPNPLAWEWNTKSLFVTYANKTANIIAVLFAKVFFNIEICCHNIEGAYVY